MLQDETLYMDRDSQIKAIEKTFEDSKKSIDKHYSKPNVVPVEILSVYPDFKVFFQERLIINHIVLTGLFSL
jgi:RNA polymerase II-associated factor 1